MAEICCGVVTETEVPTSTEVACLPSPRTARRRRMEVRRFKFVTVPADVVQKKRKFEVLSPLTVTGFEGGKVAGSLHRIKSDKCPRYGVTSVCGRRRDMEDAVSIQPNFFESKSEELNGRHHFLGVFDGHGCSHVATSCKERMHEIVADEMNRPDANSNRNWKEIMERSFRRMDAEVVTFQAVDGQKVRCRCELQTPKCDHVGSTATVAVVNAEEIVVSNCGDSRAVLCRKGVVVPLSVDHKPDRPDELERIQAAGGRVIYWDGARVLGVLAMSRAIGDSYLKPYVTAEPEVTVTRRSEDDECLIIASDGLWDVVTNEMACDIVRMCLRGNTPGNGVVTNEASDKGCSDASMLLTKLALARQSADNISVIVVDLRRNL